MEDQGLVSVIMPAYNSEAFIAESIQSVLDQTYSNWELLIIDDASTDSTPSIIQEFLGKDYRIRFLKNSTNRGTHHTRNKGIKAAQGDFIAFLDADDLWKPEKLKTQLNFLSEHDLNACYSSYELISENGERINKKVMALPVLSYAKLLKANYVGNLTGIYNSKMLGKIYSPQISKRQDWALWLEVIKKGGSMQGIQEALAVYRIRKNSISRNKLEMLRYNYRVYHDILGYNRYESLWKMLVFLNEQFFVKSKQIVPTKFEK
ncbi:glycosyltransferase family 2 protein [Christiangramia sabulilitoris]|uniref:Glycosyltransferase n=1 Tax=Christiangramia sabulilitoris TaxID=2583991 RepID=A0A550I8Q8_9FLAO|nr:glycosyltransferase [Christiangramia sabulilitoris]TRO67361.1 glycosyltransferase [Christiangramia sabulilitoris]